MYLVIEFFFNSNYPSLNKSGRQQASKSRSGSRSGKRSSGATDARKSCSTCQDRKSRDFLEELLVNTSVVDSLGKASPCLAHHNHDHNHHHQHKCQQPSVEAVVVPTEEAVCAKRRLESKSVSSVFEDTIYDTQPTLFDKYLVRIENVLLRAMSALHLLYYNTYLL